MSSFDERISKAFEKITPKNAIKTYSLPALIASMLVVMVLIKPLNSHNESTNIIGSTVNLVYQQEPLRAWNDLKEPEKERILTEALQTFPQIADIGEGVNWQPVAAWLSEQKRIQHSNVRDIFRTKRFEEVIKGQL